MAANLLPFEICDIRTSKSPKEKPRKINKQFPSLPYPLSQFSEYFEEKKYSSMMANDSDILKHWRLASNFQSLSLRNFNYNVRKLALCIPQHNSP